MKNPKHVLCYFSQFTFKLTVNGDKVLPGAWWVTKSAAAFYAELSKWYYRTAYGLDHHTVRLSGFSSDSLIAEASSRGIDLTASPAEVFQYLPKGIQNHINRFRGELEAMAVLNLDTGYQRAVASVLKNLRQSASVCDCAAQATTGAKREFLNLALGVLNQYAADFETAAVLAATADDIKPLCNAT